MAVTVKPVQLVTTFLNAEGKSVSFTYNYADITAEAADIQALMAGMIANGTIFENVPTIAKSAKFVQKTETDIPLSA